MTTVATGQVPPAGFSRARTTTSIAATPHRIRRDHAENQVAHFPAQGFPPGGVSNPRQPRPVQPEASAMPTHHRFWGDQQEWLLPPRPQLSESDPEHLVERAQSRPRSFGMQTQQLLTQCQILQHEVLAGPNSTEKPADEVPKQRNHGKNLSGRPVSDCAPSSSFHGPPEFWRTTGYSFTV